MDFPQDLLFKKDDLVKVTVQGVRTENACVILASKNGKSLVVAFEAMLGGYVGTMPLMWTEEGYFVDLIKGERVEITLRGRYATA